MNNYVRQGFGECYYTDGSIYKGYWKNDQRNGQGSITYFDGNKYEGE